MSWTPEMEAKYRSVRAEHQEVQEVLQPLRQGREKALDTLGAFVLNQPRYHGSVGDCQHIGGWFAEHADELIQMLKPFATKRPTS